MKTRLKELREQYGLNQKQMGEIIGKSQQYYQRYENKSNLPMDIATIYANHFNVSLDYLCNRPYTNNVGHIPEERKNLIKEILNLNDNEVREVESFIKGFKAGKAGTSDFSIF